jgi:hypothetical protein
MAIARRPKLVAPKKKAVRAAPAVRRGKRLTGPDFTGWESWSGAEFLKFKRHAKSFYYDNYQEADLLPEVWTWMNDNEYSVSDIKAATAASGWHGISVNVAISCKLLNTGCPDLCEAERDHWETLPGTSGELKPLTEYIRRAVDKAIEVGKDKVVEEKKLEKKKKNVYVPSIQERMREVAYEMADPIDEIIDTYITDPELFDPASYKIAALLRGKEAKAAHARLIKALYVKDLEEYAQLVSADCPKDLMEGYASYGKKNIKKMYDFLSQVVGACDQIAGEAKVLRKPRKIKVKSAEEHVKKIKFKPTDDRYAIASISPVNIVGAKSVVVFNTKTRKIGMYVAEATSQVLGVKGTAIVGFDPKKSVQKTLRKPEVQIKDFKAIGTLKRTETWLNDIKTTSTVLNGRTNADIMILKAYK